MASFASRESTMIPSKLRGDQTGKAERVKHGNKLKQEIVPKADLPKEKTHLRH
jgi:hypothetical protein